MLKFTLDGVKYEFDDNRMMNTEAIAIRRVTSEKLTVDEWGTALGKGDPEALTALVWLARRRAGEDVKFSDVEFDLIELAGSIEADKEPDAEVDPTDSTTSPEAT
jgi:hypothetical protein